MAKKIQLYIDGQTNSGDFVEIDLFEDEPIKVIDSIQNVTDINKIYDTFSRDFKVPASPNNNRVFKGFADSKITNGFDSRIKIDALIKINGQDYKKGRVRLLSVGRKNNGKASFYKVSFQGGITTIKERLGDKKLRDLNFQALSIPYTQENILAGIRDGLYARGSGAPQQQVSVITITSMPNQIGNCRVKLNGVYTYISVANDSEVNNAIDIASYINSLTGYEARAIQNTVIIVSTSTILQQETEFFSHQAIGMIGSATTVQWGGVSDTGELDKNGVKLYPDVIYAPIFTEGKVVPVPAPSTHTLTGKPYNDTFDFSLNKFTGLGSNSTSNKEEDSDEGFTVTPIAPNDYKPSVKFSRLVRMIADDYGLAFQNDFIHMEEIDQLYMFFNGKNKASSLSKKPNAFNSNAATELSRTGDTVNQIVYTTESAPLGDAVSFNGLTADLTLTTNDSVDSYVHYLRDAVGFEISYIADEASVNATINRYYYNYTGEKVILNSKSYANVPDFARAVVGVSEESNLRSESYFFDNVAGNTIYSEVIFNSVEPLTLGSIIVKPLYFKYLYTSGSGQWAYSKYEALTDTQVVSLIYLNIEGLVPDMKCIDFLTGVFKMFNLTAYINKNDEIVVQRLNDFYGDGNTIDITNSVLTDNDESESLGFKYRNISMKFQEPEDILTKNYRSLTDSIGFGDITISKESFLGDEESAEGESIGGSFGIELPFQSMMFEQIALSFSGAGVTPTGGIFSEKAGGYVTDMVIGNCIDEELNKVDTKPIIFYGKKVDQLASYSNTSSTADKITNLAGRTYTTPVAYTESGNTAGSIGKSVGGRGYVVVRDVEIATTSNPYGLGTMSTYRVGVNYNAGADDKDRWWNPSGIMASRFRRDNVTPMNEENYFPSCRFNNDNWDEFEYHNNYPPQKFINGLYQSNYEDYLKNMFLKNARLSKFKVKLKNNFLSQYKLNDTLIIGATPYTINKIEVDILTGEGTVELLNKLDLPTGTPIYDANA